MHPILIKEIGNDSEDAGVGITRVIRMDAKVEALAAAVKDQQVRIEELIERVARLETTLELTMAQRDKIPPKRLKKSTQGTSD